MVEISYTFTIDRWAFLFLPPLPTPYPVFGSKCCSAYELVISCHLRVSMMASTCVGCDSPFLWTHHIISFPFPADHQRLSRVVCLSKFNCTPHELKKTTHWLRVTTKVTHVLMINISNLTANNKRETLSSWLEERWDDPILPPPIVEGQQKERTKPEQVRKRWK